MWLLPQGPPVHGLSQQWEEDRRPGKQVSILLETKSRGSAHHFCLDPAGWNLVACPLPSAREAEKLLLVVCRSPFQSSGTGKEGRPAFFNPDFNRCLNFITPGWLCT